jgi:carbamoyl-phosphate synthase large subunit
MPTSGKVFVTVRSRDRRGVAPLARRLADLGFALVATDGTARVLERYGIAVDVVHKVGEGYRPNVIDLMKARDIVLVINTPVDGRARKDSAIIRRTAVAQDVPHYTTLDGAQAVIGAIEALLKGEHRVQSLQEYHAGLA